MCDFTTLQNFLKKFCKNIFITLTCILSNIKSFIAILFSKKVWITFLFLKKLFYGKNPEKYLKKINKKFWKKIIFEFKFFLSPY